jgi:hypothetical protein
MIQNNIKSDGRHFLKMVNLNKKALHIAGLPLNQTLIIKN